MPCIVKVRINGVKLFHTDDDDDHTNNNKVRIILRFGPFPTNHTAPLHPLSDTTTTNEDFRYEVSDDAVLQDHPLQFTVVRVDPYNHNHGGSISNNANTVIGRVSVDLNPLLAVDSPYSLAGPFPLLHPQHPQGPTGELSLQCRLQFFGDSNPFKESSAGVQFFTHPGIPRRHAALIGLVDMELTVRLPVADHDNEDLDDIDTRIDDKISQLLFEQSGQLRRVLGRKVLEMGGNAVLAYKQSIDFEEWAGTVTLRGLGTAAKLFNDDDEDEDDDGKESTVIESLQSPTNSIDLMTITVLPEQTVLSIGGLVTAKSVKLLSEWLGTAEGSERVREKWLNQLREEIKTHCRTLNCTVVLGYEESITNNGDLYVLTATGTAARIDTSACLPDNVGLIAAGSHGGNGADGDDEMDTPNDNIRHVPLLKRRRRYRDCLPCHIPYKRQQAPFEGGFVLCRLCGRRHVPQVIMATIDPPPNLDMLPRNQPTSLIEAVVCKPITLPSANTANTDNRQKAKRMASAVSLCLPFVEYDLHRQLVYKLRMIGCNAVFGLRFELRVSADNCFIALAQGTACFLAALPQPPVLRFNDQIAAGDDADMQSLQRDLSQRSGTAHQHFEDMIREHPRLGPDAVSTDSSLSESSQSTASSSTSSSSSSSSSSSDDDLASAMALVQVDDDADEDVVAVLMDPAVDGLSMAVTLEYFDTDTGCKRSSQLIVSEGSFKTDPREHHPNTLLSAAIHAFQLPATDDKQYKMDCRFVTATGKDSLLTVCTSVTTEAAITAPNTNTNNTVITCSTAAVPGHRIMANYGQVQCHMVSDLQSTIKSLLTHHALPYLSALAVSMGGNAVTSLRVIHATRTATGCCVSVAGDVAEVTAIRHQRHGSFPPQRDHHDWQCDTMSVMTTDFKAVEAGYTVPSGKRVYLLRYPAHLSLHDLFKNATMSALPATTNNAFTKRRTICTTTTGHHVTTLTDHATHSLLRPDGGLQRLEGMLAVVVVEGGVAVEKERARRREEAAVAVEEGALPVGRIIEQPDIIRKRLREITVCDGAAGVGEGTPKKKRSKKQKSDSKEE